MSWKTRARTRITISLATSDGWIPVPPMLSQRYVMPWLVSPTGGLPSTRATSSSAIAVPRPNHARRTIDRLRGRDHHPGRVDDGREREADRADHHPLDLGVELGVVADAAGRRVQIQQAQRAQCEDDDDQRPVDRGAEPPPPADADRGARQEQAGALHRASLTRGCSGREAGPLGSTTR